MLGIVDADTFLYYTVHQDLTYENMKDYLDKRVSDVLSAAKVDRYLMTLTSGSFRYNISTTREYKGNRKEVTKKPEFYALKEYMSQKYKAITLNNMEADDLCIYFQESIKEDSIVVSPDKDLIRQSTHSFNYNPHVMEEVTQTPDKIFYNIYHQMITGDPTDNIEGVHGTGTKKADIALKSSKNYPATALSLFSERYGPQDGMFRFVEAYRLIYLLRNDKDVEREYGEEIPYNEYLKNNINILKEESVEGDKNVW